MYLLLICICLTKSNPYFKTSISFLFQYSLVWTIHSLIGYGLPIKVLKTDICILDGGTILILWLESSEDDVQSVQGNVGKLCQRGKIWYFLTRKVRKINYYWRCKFGYRLFIHRLHICEIYMLLMLLLVLKCIEQIKKRIPLVYHPVVKLFIYKEKQTVVIC